MKYSKENIIDPRLKDMDNYLKFRQLDVAIAEKKGLNMEPIYEKWEKEDKDFLANQNSNTGNGGILGILIFLLFFWYVGSGLFSKHIGL